MFLYSCLMMIPYFNFMKANFVRSGIHKDSSKFLLLSNGRDIAVKGFKSVLKPQINEGSMSRNWGLWVIQN